MHTSPPILSPGGISSGRFPTSTSWLRFQSKTRDTAKPIFDDAVSETPLRISPKPLATRFPIAKAILIIGAPLRAAPRPGTARVIVAPAKSLELAHHLLLGAGGRVRDRPCRAGRLESAATIERDGGVIVGGDPENEPTSATGPRPTGDLLDQRGTYAALARRFVDEHTDERGERLIHIRWPGEEASRQTNPPAVLLGDERDAVDTGRPAGRSFLPDIVGERLLARERRPERQGRVGKGVKAERAQPLPLMSPNTPNVQAHESAAVIARSPKGDEAIQGEPLELTRFDGWP
jgi:hypothetical protein